LLVTKDFFASDFIAEQELPMLFDRSTRQEIRIAWIAVGYSSFEQTPLAQFQAVNDPKYPLMTLDRSERDKVMVDIAKKIADAVTIRTLAGGLRIIDETTESIEAVLENRPEEGSRSFLVQAEYEPTKDRISFTGSYEKIWRIPLTVITSGGARSERLLAMLAVLLTARFRHNLPGSPN